MKPIKAIIDSPTSVTVVCSGTTTRLNSFSPAPPEPLPTVLANTSSRHRRPRRYRAVGGQKLAVDAVLFAPDDIIGGIDDAVDVVIARSVGQTVRIPLPEKNSLSLYVAKLDVLP